MKKYKLALVGATGLVGRKALQVLEEFNLPISEYAFFCSSRSAGQKIKFMGKEYITRELKEDSFDEGFDFAIFSAGGDTSKKFSPIAASKGCIVVDNSSAFRMDPTVPLVVPEVNMDSAFKNHGIIANPNCSTIQAVIPLKALDEKYKIKRVVYSTYQAVSGGGKLAVDDFYNTQKGLEPKKWPHPIYNNCLPHIDVFLENGYTKEEMKVVNETKKILHLDDSTMISCTAARVPVFNGHSEAVDIEFNEEVSPEKVREILSNAYGVKVIDNPANFEYPTTRDASGVDPVFVGRIRKNLAFNNGISLWCVADNLRIGAALNTVRICKRVIEMGLF